MSTTANLFIYVKPEENAGKDLVSICNLKSDEQNKDILPVFEKNLVYFEKLSSKKEFVDNLKNYFHSKKGVYRYADYNYLFNYEKKIVLIFAGSELIQIFNFANTLDIPIPSEFENLTFEIEDYI
jgi:hypothetical protein